MVISVPSDITEVEGPLSPSPSSSGSCVLTVGIFFLSFLPNHDENDENDDESDRPFSFFVFDFALEVEFLSAMPRSPLRGMNLLNLSPFLLPTVTVLLELRNKATTQLATVNPMRY